MKSFETEIDKREETGEFFNPIMATMITGSARLILAMAEAIAIKNNGYIAYMDTDSIFVNPEIVKIVQDFFKPLNPYSIDTEMFKIEEDDNKNPLDNVMFYGISAKRYCLFREFEGKPEILKYSTHGLGQYKDIDGKKVWESILTNDFYPFDDKIAVSQLTITKPSILKRFKTMNRNKPFSKQTKPFNFIIVGIEVDDVIPAVPYTTDYNGIQY